MVTLAFCAYLIAFLAFTVRDIIWLRMLAITASAGLTWSEVLQPEPRLATVVWHPIFVVVNVAWLVRLTWLERRVVLSPEERTVYERRFRSFSRLDFRTLARKGRWRQGAVGDVLTVEGEPVSDLVVIVQGAADVVAGGRTIAHLTDGQLVGEMSLVADGPASATVTLTKPSTLIAWAKDDLRRLRMRRPSLRFALDAAIGSDLSEMLRGRASVS